MMNSRKEYNDRPSQPSLSEDQRSGQLFRGVHRTIERWAEKGSILAIKVEGSTRISRDSVIGLEVEGINKKLFREGQV